ncbi:hypothetical protein AMTRI_Chr11g154950 [Amborella trichopoda]
MTIFDQESTEEFTFPTVPNDYHEFSVSKDSFWVCARKASNCSFPICAQAHETNSPEFEIPTYQPKAFPSRHTSSMDKLWEITAKEAIGSLRKFSIDLDDGRKSFVSARDDDGYDEEDEEKMDSLWEEYNDDVGQLLARKDGVGQILAGKDGVGQILTVKDCRKMKGAESVTSFESDAEGHEIGHLGCIQALKISKAGIPLKRPGLQMILKVLRKLLMLHTSHFAKKD